MRITHWIPLLVVIFTATPARAQDCSAQFSMCLTAVASNPSANGTDECISQRTACVAMLQGTPGVTAAFDPFAVAIISNPDVNLRKEHREQNRALIKSQIDEQQELRERQRAERDANNWREFGTILKQQAGERQQLRKEQREDRRQLSADQKYDGKWMAW